MASTPALSPDARKEGLDALGMPDVAPYEVGLMDGSTPKEGEGKTLEEIQAAEVETPVEAPVTPAAAPETPVAAPEQPATPVEAPAEEVDPVVAYLDNLVDDPAPEASATADSNMAAIRSLLERQIATGQVATPAARDDIHSPTTASGATVAVDPSTFNWSDPAVQAEIQRELDASDGDPAKAIGTLMAKFGTLIQTQAIAPQIEELKAQLNQREATATTKANQAEQWRLLQTVPAALAENYEGHPVAAVATQFLTGLSKGVKDGVSREGVLAGLQSSVLGRHLLANPGLSSSAQGIQTAALAVAAATDIGMRANGSTPAPVLQGTREEVTAALGKAHGVDPTNTPVEGNQSPEEGYIKQMLDAPPPGQNVDGLKKLFG